MMNEQEYLDLYNNLTQELRRGILGLATLSHLKADKYGYALINSLAERGLEIDQGTLYPLLRRLESQGLLQSAWNTEGPRPRRYYVISPLGLRALESLTADWRSLVRVMEGLLDESSSQ
ncbi:MAG: PadR family transcriptional regulator [Chloroflexi bacterium]|nr:PadR family transcriptional regulator [Chloroflexota bacterium]